MTSRRGLPLFAAPRGPDDELTIFDIGAALERPRGRPAPARAPRASEPAAALPRGAAKAPVVLRDLRAWWAQFRQRRKTPRVAPGAQAVDKRAAAAAPLAPPDERAGALSPATERYISNKSPPPLPDGDWAAAGVLVREREQVGRPERGGTATVVPSGAVGVCSANRVSPSELVRF